MYRDFEKGCKVVGHVLQVVRKNKIDEAGGIECGKNLGVNKRDHEW